MKVIFTLKVNDILPSRCLSTHFQAGHSPRGSSSYCSDAITSLSRRAFQKSSWSLGSFSSVPLLCPPRTRRAGFYINEKNNHAPFQTSVPQAQSPISFNLCKPHLLGFWLSSLSSCKLRTTDPNLSRITVPRIGRNTPAGTLWEMRNQCDFLQMFPKSCYPGTKTTEGRKQGSFYKILC